ncbi:MAG: peptidase M1 [Flavobacteriales bacterium]|nr:MAG: peptidase M1 [Flavobacteriales bacterium]
MKRLFTFLGALMTVMLMAQNDFILEKNDFWNVTHYNIEVQPFFENKSLKGTNEISFEIKKDTINPIFKIDLHQPMNYRLLGSSMSVLSEKRLGNQIFIQVKKEFEKGEKGFLKIEFSGQPKTVSRYQSPWKNGWVFAKDKWGNDFASVAQEHDGVALWLPTKDVWYDEPDNGIIMKIVVPQGLVGVGNGKLIAQTKGEELNTYTWQVKNPINPYAIVPNIGKYVHFKDEFNGEKGKLNLDYWVLGYNLEKAKKHFQQVQPMLHAFEFWFGAYPFYEDTYKLVETPYLGMEHQSNVAYGNKYQNGYLGSDLSGTGVGLSWDFIIVHETGHEWFANNITAKDIADMWIHESFTCYAETLFVEKWMDKKSADQYVQGIRKNILNDKPIIGKTYGKEGSGDMYYKGANMLHTIRMVINNDELFRQILRGLNKDFYHQTVTTKQVEDYISKKSGIDFSTVFNQYLRTTKIPVLEYQQKGNQLKFRYQNVVENFTLPININENLQIYPTENWQEIQLPFHEKIQWNQNYYIDFRDY